MTKEREALKLALEALEINLVFLRNVKPFKGQEDLATDCIAMTGETITAAKEALAQPEQQEPVAEIEFLDWVHPKLGVTKVEVEGGKPLVLKAKIKLPTPKKCTNCASLEDELERAKIKSAVWKSAYDVERGYNEQDTTPPQRTWVGLTDVEINEIWASQNKTGEQITRDIEAKLKEKNT